MDVSGKILGAIGIVIITICLLALTPTIVDTVQGIRTDDNPITGELLGVPDNTTTKFYFDYPPCKENTETIKQNTTEVTNYIYLTNGGIIGINFTTAPLEANGNITADYTQRGWDFTGHEGAEAMLGLVPFVWVAGILISSTVGMFALAKGKK